MDHNIPVSPMQAKVSSVGKNKGKTAHTGTDPLSGIRLTGTTKTIFRRSSGVHVILVHNNPPLFFGFSVFLT